MRGEAGVPLRVYACPYGPHHHLTSRFKPQERCGACLEPYEATGPDDWRCQDCTKILTGYRARW